MDMDMEARPEWYVEPPPLRTGGPFEVWGEQSPYEAWKEPPRPHYQGRRQMWHSWDHDHDLDYELERPMHAPTDVWRPRSSSPGAAYRPRGGKPRAYLYEEAPESSPHQGWLGAGGWARRDDGAEWFDGLEGSWGDPMAVYDADGRYDGMYDGRPALAPLGRSPRRSSLSLGPDRPI